MLLTYDVLLQVPKPLQLQLQLQLARESAKIWSKIWDRSRLDDDAAMSLQMSSTTAWRTSDVYCAKP